MSNNEQELFKDYVAEVIEYDHDVDFRVKHKDTNTQEKKSTTSVEKISEQKVAETKDLFKNYKPQTVEYNEEIDGSDEHKIREEHLDVKQDLLGKIRKAKAKAKGNQTTFRGNIRTENEQ